MSRYLQHIQDGARVALRSVHGKYLSAQLDGSAQWNRDVASTWEYFHIQERAGGKITLKSSHGKYVSAQADGSVQINRDAAPPGGWEEFTAELRENGVVCLKSCHGKYLSAQQNGTAQWNRDHAPRGGWEDIQFVQQVATGQQQPATTTASMPSYVIVAQAGSSEVNGNYELMPGKHENRHWGTIAGHYQHTQNPEIFIAFQDCGKTHQRPEWNKWMIISKIGVLYAAHTGGKIGVPPRVGVWENVEAWGHPGAPGGKHPAPTVYHPPGATTQTQQQLNTDRSTTFASGENILVSQHSLPEYNGIYTIQNNEINGKPWFKNNSGCILYFYNANSGGGPSWSLDDRSQDGTNDWFRGGWIEPPNSGGPPLGTRSWAILETHRRFEIKIESVSIPDESSEPILNSDGRKYVFAHEHNGWHWHNERARAMGGHLASITNGIENEQITRISGGAPVWIGGIRKGSGNGPSADHWYWDDGRPWSYTNWHPGEPNNSGGGENRVHLGLQAPGTWNDVLDQWHGPAVYLVPNIASATPKSSSSEIDMLAQFKSKLKVSDSHLRRIDELSSKYKKK